MSRYCLSSGEDFEQVNIEVALIPNVDRHKINVTIVDDKMHESEESFTCTITLKSGQSGVAVGRDQVTVYISDDDGMFTLHIITCFIQSVVFPS